ncbi:MAG TPA: DUF3300 domain-containing protein [Thermoanaerobaculaceae bacterium]|nr:DUF3300 domain-containing protein [Thermoanaerobaculaceae bacterium]
MRIALAVSLVVVLSVLGSPLSAQDDAEYEPFSAEQLDNLLAPIALYPDPLLAQVLLAATFPDQIDEASRFLRDDPNPDDIDGQPWDVSVKAVAHYPEVLDMMADKLDWTTALGQAYVNQSTDVMASVQRLRAQAQQAGNLATTPEMEVVTSGGEIELWPAQPQYLYVPVYDPALVFFFRAPLFFRARFFIGAWLNCDFDWREHRIFYHGWEHERGWVERSRPFIHVTNVYVNTSYRTVVVNRNVVRERVNYRALDRYDDVHRTVNFNNLRSPVQGTYNPPPPARVEAVHNKVIVRNVNTADPRLYEYRGHVSKPPTPVHVEGLPAFTPSHGGFDPHKESVRGQASRMLVKATPSPHPPVKNVERKRP